MKKMILCGVLFLLFTMCCTASADSNEVFEYVISDNEAHITRYLGAEAHLVIPDELGGYPVTSISMGYDSADAERKNILLTVTLPESLTKLDDYGFYGCRNLYDIIGLDHVEYIGYYALNGFTKTNWYLPSLKEIGYDAFYNTNCAEITVRDNLIFDRGPFMNMLALKQLNLIETGEEPTLRLEGELILSPDRKELLGVLNARMLSSFEIPSHIETIGYGALTCLGRTIKELVIPHTVHEIQTHAFSVISTCKVVIFEDSDAYLQLDGYYDYVKNNLEIVPSGSTYLSFDKQITDITLECIAGYETEYDKAKVIHDWIINNIEYDYSYSYMDAVSALEYGKCICAGYADLYQVMLTKAGIQNYKTGNFEHQFNALYVDGNWMMVDCTWDDGNDYLYFGFEKTMRNLIYGGEDLVSGLSGPSTSQIVSARNYYWYRNGYLDSTISNLRDTVNAWLERCDSVNLEISFPSLTQQEIMGTACAAILRETEWTYEGSPVSLSFSYEPSMQSILVSNYDSPEDIQDFTFEIRNNCIEITSYTGTDTEVVVPAKIYNKPVAYIADAFTGNKTIRRVQLPDTVIEIGHNAFLGCVNLCSINMPLSLQVIGDYAFRDCIQLSDQLILPNGLTVIGVQAFQSTSVPSVTIPASVQMIRDCAFLYCQSLANLEFEPSTDPQASLVIFSSAFGDCTALTSVSLPDYCVALGNTVFSNSGVQYLTIGSELQRIGSIGIMAQLKEINISENNDHFSLVDRMLIQNDNHVLLAYIRGGTNVSISIPDTVQEIAYSAFNDVDEIVSVRIPGSVGTLGDYCFRDCGNLTEVVIEEGTQVLGEAVFADCQKLKVVSLADSITSIGTSCFNGCFNIQSINVPRGITVIPMYFISIAENLYVHEQVVGCKVGFPQSPFFTTQGSYTMTVHGVKGSYAEILAKENNHRFMCVCNGEVEIDKPIEPTCTEAGKTEGKHCSVCGNVLVEQEEIDALGHTEVIDHAVAPTCNEAGKTEGKHCSVCGAVLVEQEIVNATGHIFEDGTCIQCGLTAPKPEECEMKLPFTLNTIYEEAFMGGMFCSVYIPDNVTVIGSHAFANCENLQYVFLPMDVNIAEDAFAYCPEDIVFIYR